MSTATLDRFSRYTGWAAYLSGAIAFISGVFLFLFYLFTLAPSAPGATAPIDFGYLNDIVGLFSTILMLPVPVALYWLTRRQGRALGLVAMALGLVGMLAIIVGQTLLIKDVISFDTSLPFSLIGLALLGVWLILANYLGRAGGVLARWLAWLGGLTGAALLLAVEPRAPKQPLRRARRCVHAVRRSARPTVLQRWLEPSSRWLSWVAAPISWAFRSGSLALAGDSSPLPRRQNRARDGALSQTCGKRDARWRIIRHERM